jgi:hypothetical protein
MQDSNKGLLPMSHVITLSKKLCPSEPDEQKRMRAIPYTSPIVSIIYAMLCTRPDVSYGEALAIGSIMYATSMYQSNYGETH